mgnify:FL=1
MSEPRGPDTPADPAASDGSGLVVRARRWVATIDTDLAAVVVAVVGSASVLLSGIDAPVSWLVGVPFLLFWPGYATVSALLPMAVEIDTRPSVTADQARLPSPGWPARLGLSLLLSMIVVAIVGIGIDRVASIRLGPAVVGISVVTVVGVVVAAYRRRQLPPAARAAPLGTGRPRVGSVTSGAGSVRSSRHRWTLVLAVVLLFGTASFVAVTPAYESSYTESYLLTENDTGSLVAEGYPTTVVVGESQLLAVGVENHEHRSITYTVDLVVERVGPNGSVADQQRVDRFRVELAHGERSIVERQVHPTLVGDTVRIEARVYKSPTPSTADEPDQTTHLWIEVVDPTSG